jgi:integrase
MSRNRARAGSGHVSRYTLRDGTVRYRIAYRAADQANGVTRQRTERGFASEKEAVAALRAAQRRVDTGTFVGVTRLTVGEHFERWLAGHRVKPSTLSSYRQKVRLHITPHIGDVPLQRLTTAQVDALYRTLESTGRQTGGGLSPKTVRYVHTILRKALSSAVLDGLIPRNPTDRAKPPTAREAASPEKQTWTGDQIRRFLDAERHHSLHPLWIVYATTGMRRGEALALRWSDLDLERGKAVVRRSVGKVDGKVVESTTKSSRSRVVDLDAFTVQALTRHKTRQAQERLRLGAAWVDQGLVFARGGERLGSATPGGFLNPDHVWKTLQQQVVAYNKTAPAELVLPAVSVHELRHSWATLAMQAGVHPKVVQERLGHANIAITLDVYSHTVESMQREAAETIAQSIFG